VSSSTNLTWSPTLSSRKDTLLAATIHNANWGVNTRVAVVKAALTFDWRTVVAPPCPRDAHRNNSRGHGGAKTVRDRRQIGRLCPLYGQHARRRRAPPAAAFACAVLRFRPSIATPSKNKHLHRRNSKLW